MAANAGPRASRVVHHHPPSNLSDSQQGIGYDSEQCRSSDSDDDSDSGLGSREVPEYNMPSAPSVMPVQTPLTLAMGQNHLQLSMAVPGMAPNSTAGMAQQQQQQQFRHAGQPPPGNQSNQSARKRNTSSDDKERKRLKRLLRNRVSAQQARERKKAYLTDLEVRAKELEARNAQLEEKLTTLQRENFMLRQVVKNTTLKKQPGAGAGGSGVGGMGGPQGGGVLA
ncbi:hypothetical protein CBR_g22875 [Chara braunii]|uniref:BZIP domain-containing protein n=1 Tax=Chara braunii TaxID=69332 RepID=A0A388L325_CHABU|nr:hypothetical protein CBR_g22875 [Chara braunii]|eukprot:GBG76658.1 hypothetical protein CBR_g22875 [Chara braunii]